MSLLLPQKFRGPWRFKYYYDDNTFLIVINAGFLLHYSPDDFEFLKGKNYHFIITHGIISEILSFVKHQNAFNLNKDNITVMSNNVELSLELSKLKIKHIGISESIFINDDLYYIDTQPKIYDSVFSGRPVKIEDILNQNYNFISNIHKNYISQSDGKFKYNIKDIYKLYNKSKSGIVPSISEGSCRTINELLLCGVPIVDIKFPEFSEENVDFGNCYSQMLPNTLGGRELYLDHNNSVIVPRTPKGIDDGIQELIKRNLCPDSIRKDFLAKLNNERLKFLLFLKGICLNLEINPPLNSFVNPPYSNSSIDSNEWKKVKKHFDSLY